MFPPNVALPLGGPGARMILLIEMHYDNPTLQTGIVFTAYIDPAINEPAFTVLV